MCGESGVREVNSHFLIQYTVPNLGKHPEIDTSIL